MLLYLTGVVDNGAALGPDVPVDQHQTLRYPLGANATIRLTVVDNSGVAVDLTGCTCALEIKRSPLERVPVIQRKTAVNIPSLGKNVADFTFVPTDFAYVPTGPGRYMYEVWLTDAASKRSPIVPLSVWLLQAAIVLP